MGVTRYWSSGNVVNSTPTINSATRTMIQVGGLRQVEKTAAGKIEGRIVRVRVRWI